MEAVRADDQIRVAGVCLSALELADRLGCRADECAGVYYVALSLG